MKTRIIFTKFWEDEYIGQLKVDEKLLFFYLLTNDRVGLGSTYECADRIIMFETGISDKRLTEIKEKFERDNRFLFDESYIFIINYEKYNQYRGEKNDLAREKEEEIIGKSRIKVFQDRVSIPYISPSDTSINHKSEIINHKSEIKNKEEDEMRILVEMYNQIFEKNTSSIKGFESNYGYWKEVHGLEKIQQALENARKDKFWKDKMTLTILFRRKNTNGETVDYIEDLSSRKPNSGGSVAII